MYGKNLFEVSAVNEILERLNNLTNQSPRQWGKMNVSQMLAHCSNSLEMALGLINPPPTFFSWTIGPLLKFIYTNNSPFKKGSPTDSALIIVDERDFMLERERLKNIISQFHNGGPNKVTTHPHPFFGHLNPDQWSRGMYKHLDHHLKQFLS